jgi:hypothetical protein
MKKVLKSILLFSGSVIPCGSYEGDPLSSPEREATHGEFPLIPA